jgi:hypothetical protein
LSVGACRHTSLFGENIRDFPDRAQNWDVHSPTQWKILSIRVIGDLFGKKVTVSMASDKEINP